MWLKIAGCAMIVAAGTGLGFAMAARFSQRPRQIRQLISCLTSLGSYIRYVSMPLPEALAHAAGGIGGPVAETFRTAAGILAERGWLSPRDALEAALNGTGARLAWGSPEKEILLLLGANLGNASREELHRYLAMVIGQLGEIEREAIKLREQNARMYRYLGVCGGLAVAILLV